MATKTSPWAKWPGQWLKRLPGAPEEPSRMLILASEALTRVKSANPKPEIGHLAIVHRFEDFVKGPIRSPQFISTDGEQRRSSDALGRGPGGVKRGPR